MSTATRYILGYRLGGETWYVARDPRKFEPMLTPDPSRAHEWDSPGAARAFLDSIPVETPGPKGKPIYWREWMEGKEIKIFPVKRTIGQPVGVAS